MNTRESIYTAVLAQATPAGNLLQTVSRQIRLIDQLEPPEMPALYLVQGKQTASTKERVPTVWRFYAELVLYAHAQAAEQQGLPDVMSLINNLTDAVLAALSPFPVRLTQTLGGLVTDVRVQGEIEVFEGRIANGARRAAAFIPLEIIPNL